MVSRQADERRFKHVFHQTTGGPHDCLAPAEESADQHEHMTTFDNSPPKPSCAPSEGATQADERGKTAPVAFTAESEAAFLHAVTCPEGGAAVRETLLTILDGLYSGVVIHNPSQGGLFRNRAMMEFLKTGKLTLRELDGLLEEPAIHQTQSGPAADEFQTAAGAWFQSSAAKIPWLNNTFATLTILKDVSEIHQTKDALRDSEAKLTAIIDNAAQAIVLTDDNGAFTLVNPAFEEMFGYTAEEAFQLTHLDVTHPDFVDTSRDKLQSIVQGDLQCYRMEKQYVRKDESVFWGDLSVTPVRSLDRRVGAAVGVIGDITERKRAEEALRESEARFRATLDNLAQTVTLTDANGKFTHVNAAWEKMMGYTAEEAKNLTHLDITHPDDVDVSNEKLQAVVRGDLDSYRLEKRYVRKDGSVFWGDLTCTPVRTLDRTVGAAVAVIVDISNRKQAQEELQRSHDALETGVAERTKELAIANQELINEIAERARAQEALKLSEERFRAIFETAKDCIFIKNRSLQYTLVNPAMESLLELPAAEIMRLRDIELYGMEDGDYLHRLDMRVLTGESIETEHTRTIRGIPMTFLDIRAPMKDESDRIIGICGISRNITERKDVPHRALTMQESQSPVMRSTFAEALMAAKTDIIILLTGESGAGKDHLASFIHKRSRRAGGPFYAINCAAIPPELAESELFGHESGAFTGANRRKRGLLELAEGGTLLLNEIGELPNHIQAKLLTFLDTRSFTRVGGEKSITVSARLIAATNRDLNEEVAQGRFRLDLYYRLNVLSIRVPPLRDRSEDIPTLVEQILHQLAGELQLPRPPGIHDDDMAKLCAYKWPGNVRELRNVLERSLIVSEGPLLRFDFLDGRTTECEMGSWTVCFPPKPSLVEVMTDLKRNIILEALSRCSGNKQEAARILGVSRYALRRRMLAVGLLERK